MAKCFVCEYEIGELVVPASGNAIINCPVCSKFEASERVQLNPEGLEHDQRHIYSGAIRENETDRGLYFLRDIPTLLASVRVPKNPFEKLDKLLLAIEKRSTYYGDELYIDWNTDYSLAYAKNTDEFSHLVNLAMKLGYISENSLTLDTEGIRRLIEIHETEVRSDQAFVAMWFDISMDSTYAEGIAPALTETGFEPMLIKNKEHNNKIDDEIFAEINRSGLVIADFTGHRQSVYFEAGYAKGLGIQVIFTCREDEIKKAHFDTRQYSHITWTTSDDLKKKLSRRIEATRPHRR